MADIQSTRLLYMKAVLFVVIGGLASALLVLERASVRTAALLAIAVWAFARAYYFAFYVIEHYVDPGYRFEGLVSFLRYLMRGAESWLKSNAPKSRMARLTISLISHNASRLPGKVSRIIEVRHDCHFA